MVNWYKREISMGSKIHLYYGNGKGKTTAATGLAIRALGAGLKVCIIYFDKGHKEENEHYAERSILRAIPNCELFPTGCERIMDNGKFRFGVKPMDIEEAKRGLEIAETKINDAGINLLILDEILATVAYDLLKKEDIMSLIELYKKSRPFELVMTGHTLWKELEDEVDLISHIQSVKHYFDKGQEARLGIEF